MGLFRELSASRPYTEAGPQAIPVSEMVAMQSVLGVEFHPWEFRLLRRLDVAWYKAWRDGRPRPA